MKLGDYNTVIAQNGFEEFPEVLTGNEVLLESFLNYSESDISLKRHLCQMLICRSFPPTGGVILGDDLKWFITGFLDEFKTDLHKPWLTTVITEAIHLVNNTKNLSQRIIGTSFMFTIIESYLKHYLGYRPEEYNFFDKKKKEYLKEHYKDQKKVPNDITLGQGIEILKAKDLAISNALKEIDDFSIKFLLSREIEQGNWIVSNMTQRLTTIRNAMLHGEISGFYEIGDYLIMTYILFHLHTADNNSFKILS